MKAVRQGPIRVAVVGVGNCASSLVQGVRFCKDAHASESVPGLLHVVHRLDAAVEWMRRLGVRTLRTGLMVRRCAPARSAGATG